MTRKINIYILLIGFFFTVFACKEFLEEDIKDREITLLSPGNQAEIAIYNITFMWDHMEDALDYQLQIVSPGFDSVNLYHADTIVYENKFTLSLEPGKYQWRVRGLNGSSQSRYTTRSFVIYESDLTKQTVILTAPGDKVLTGNTSLRMGWQQLFGATGYRLQIDTANFASEEDLVYNNVLEGTSFSFTIPKEQNYQWRVRAETDTAQSLWSATRTFGLDKTPPAVPALTAPANNASLPNPVTLRWEGVSDAAKYQLYVYKSDSTTLFSPAYPLTLEGTTHNFNGGTVGEQVLWRLRATDKAGNTSDFTPYWSFTINQ